VPATRHVDAAAERAHTSEHQTTNTLCFKHRSLQFCIAPLRCSGSLMTDPTGKRKFSPGDPTTPPPPGFSAGPPRTPTPQNLHKSPPNFSNSPPNKVSIFPIPHQTKCQLPPEHPPSGTPTSFPKAVLHYSFRSASPSYGQHP
jgi:hypothetical protein